MDEAEGLTHLDEQGRARMVDVSEKPDSERVAIARGSIAMSRATLEKILSGDVNKGDVLGVAQTAGILAAKRTWELIPMCHPIRIGGIKLEFETEADDDGGRITAYATVKNIDKTGVEMEALTAVSVALLTIYDMAKSLEQGMTLERIELLEKRDGRSGVWKRP
ncbi:MAG: cyclic pyranopterin monophosphate synthase MoaC [Candidatus Bipolaricaulia bacterium]